MHVRIKRVHQAPSLDRGPQNINLRTAIGPRATSLRPCGLKGSFLSCPPTIDQCLVNLETLSIFPQKRSRSCAMVKLSSADGFVLGGERKKRLKVTGRSDTQQKHRQFKKVKPMNGGTRKAEQMFRDLQSAEVEKHL